MQLLLTRVSSGLAPDGKQAWDDLQKLRVGLSYLCDVKLARSPQQLRLYWALITKAWENQSGYATKEDLSAAALCAIGHCYRIKHGDDVVIERPKSIAFGNLDQAEFNQIYDAVADLLAEKLGVTVESLRQEAADSTLPASIRNAEITP